MRLWVGLGNPGNRYEQTLHNLGVLAIQQLFSNISVEENNKIKSLVLKNHSITDTVIIFPQTFMNLSGTAVRAALEYFNIAVNDLIVFHDEVELPYRTIKYKFGNGHKGHNGLRNIIDRIGSSDFHRIRLGIGRPADQNESLTDFLLNQRDVSDYVCIETLRSILQSKEWLS